MWSDDGQLVVAHFKSSGYNCNLVIGDVLRRASSSVICDARIDDLLHVFRHPRRIGTHVITVRLDTLRFADTCFYFNVTDVRSYQPVQRLRPASLFNLRDIAGIAFDFFSSSPTGAISVCGYKEEKDRIGCSIYVVQTDSRSRFQSHDDE